MRKVIKYLIIILIIAVLSDNLKTFIEHKQNPSLEKQEEIRSNELNKIKKSESNNLEVLNDKLTELNTYIKSSNSDTCSMMERGTINLKLKLINRKANTIHNNIQSNLKEKDIKFEESKAVVDNSSYNSIKANEKWINTCSIDEKNYNEFNENIEKLAKDIAFLENN